MYIYIYILRIYMVVYIVKLILKEFKKEKRGIAYLSLSAKKLQTPRNPYATYAKHTDIAWHSSSMLPSLTIFLIFDF